MAKSVLELAVGTGQWDAGLKKAKNALDNFTQANGGLQSALNKDSASMQKFVQMMGQMDSTAKTAKGQMNDYKSTIEQLTMQYNRMTDAQKQTIGQDYLRAIDQMKQKYQGVADEVAKINQSLKTMPEPAAATGGGLFSGDKLGGMLQVFGGNLMTKGFELATSAATNFINTIHQAAAEGIELARQGEGIRNAFERLNEPGLLDNLREATHGTVTNLELMKAAVKFNDFKLPLKELGTMLAFAQQKAKDTGQSVDYMVDSIVTGLGRKSLMILDNLGLSATEIRDKMKETGDMTSAVGAIIREQMASAGDYIETAADRATAADVEVKNAMEELGRTLLPLQEQGESMWNALTIGAIKLLNEGITPLVPGLIKLKENIGDIWDTVTNNPISTGVWNWLTTGVNIATTAIPVLNTLRNTIANLKKEAGQDLAGSVSIGGLAGAIKNRKKPANELDEIVVTPQSSTSTSTPKGGTTKPDLSKVLFDPNKAALAAIKGDDGGVSDVFAAYKESLKEQTDTTNDLIEAFKKLNKAEGVDTNEHKQRNEPQGEYKSFSDEMNKITQGVSGIISGIEQLGVDIPQGLRDVLGGIQAVAGILTGISALVTIITAIQGTKSIPVIGWMLSHGGVVPHAANGYYVPGTHASGDVTPIMANAGELVLNKSSQGNLANDLKGAEALVQTIDRYQESIMRGSQMGNVAADIKGGNDAAGGSPYITGEIIYMGLSAYLKSSGRGEIVTSRTRG